MKKILFTFVIMSGICLGIVAAAKSTSAAAPASKVAIVKLKNGHYQLTVNKKPYLIKGVCYSPIPIGQSYDYDFWNDPAQPWKIDGELMKKMGINTVRFYQPGQNTEAVKKAINDLYAQYGIRTIMGHWLGFWNAPTPFYADENFRKQIKKEVLAMVGAYKDEPGLLLWVLGNENNYSFSGRINYWSSPEIDALKDPGEQMKARARIYYSFINELTEEIHRIDPHHPVGLGNGELATLDIAKAACPAIDFLACIIYRGKSFGNIFKNLKTLLDKPIVFVEFGCDAYDAYQKREDQDIQAKFIESQWVEIFANIATNPDGQGNCLGGTLFEWNDEWWKHNEFDPKGWFTHDTDSNWSNGSYYFDIKAEGNKNMNEEWFGVVGLSEQTDKGINKRVPRKVYYVLRELWKNPQAKIKAIKALKEKKEAAKR